ncbi:MAG: hypothetical protein RIF32_00510, partial [Leptospirales bacterium]
SRESQSFFALFLTLVISAGWTELRAQSLNLQPGTDSGSQLEKFPTPRDPSYVPPLLPQSALDSANQSEAGGSALIFSAGGGGDLVTLFTERRAAQLEAARRADRYGERNAQYLDETGQDRALLEQNLRRQFGSSRGLPRDFGDSRYSETPARRFSIVFFLSLPITAGVVGGLYQAFGPGVSINGPADYPALLGILGVGGVFSALIGYYDYTQMRALRAHTVGHRARESYELRNHPFGRRGVKDNADAAADTTPDSTFQFRGQESPPSPTMAPLYFQKAYRWAAAEEARRLLESKVGAGARPDIRAGNDGAGEDPASRLGISWRFAY